MSESASLTPPRRRTAADEAELALFEGIMKGALPPGAPLRLQDLAEKLDMSMMPIREALRRLESLGLVEIVAHKGAWVRPLTLEDLYDTYFTRLHLESLAIAMAARQITPETIKDARSALAEKRAADEDRDPLGSRDAHERFHFLLYEASGSAWLVRSIWPAWRNSERYRVESMRNPAHVRRREGEHDGLLDALAAHDTDQAVRLIVTHLRSSVELVATTLTPSGQAPPITLPSMDALLTRGLGSPPTDSGRPQRT